MGPKLNNTRDRNRFCFKKNVWGSNREYRIISKNVSDTNKCVKQKLQNMKYYISRWEVFDGNVTLKHPTKMTLESLNREPYSFYSIFLKSTFRHFRTIELMTFHWSRYPDFSIKNCRFTGSDRSRRTVEFDTFKAVTRAKACSVEQP